MLKSQWVAGRRPGLGKGWASQSPPQQDKHADSCPPRFRGRNIFPSKKQAPISENEGDMPMTVLCLARPRPTWRTVRSFLKRSGARRPRFDGNGNGGQPRSRPRSRPRSPGACSSLPSFLLSSDVSRARCSGRESNRSVASSFARSADDTASGRKRLRLVHSSSRAEGKESNAAGALRNCLLVSTLYGTLRYYVYLNSVAKGNVLSDKSIYRIVLWDCSQ